MQDFFAKIDQIKDLIKAPELNAAEIIKCQKSLIKHEIAPLPEAYVEFLHHCNGLRYNGACLSSIYPEQTLFIDILSLNLLLHHPLHRDLIILGFNEFDYLAYNLKWQVYQIIDKDDLEVLEEYTELELALNHFLKI